MDEKKYEELQQKYSRKIEEIEERIQESLRAGQERQGMKEMLEIKSGNSERAKK